MLTEREVSRSWSRMFKDGLSEEALANAEDLLSELRAESPLRLRLENELAELRDMYANQVQA